MSDPLGIYLKELRKKAGLSLDEAAREIGVPDRNIVSAWESGIEVPSIEHSRQIAQIYAISEEEVREILVLEAKR